MVHFFQGRLKMIAHQQETPAASLVQCDHEKPVKSMGHVRGAHLPMVMDGSTVPPHLSPMEGLQGYAEPDWDWELMWVTNLAQVQSMGKTDDANGNKQNKRQPQAAARGSAS